jgi:tripartite-type tricarboxylate transporter receptor subunit TctC
MPIRSTPRSTTPFPTPDIFVIRSDLPAKTMKEFVALARANPEKFNVSVPPIGTAGHLQAEMLKIRENLPRMETVVFKGGGDALQALLSGTVQLNAGSIPPTMPHIQAGTVRCLAVLGETRWPDLPDVPTMEEAGYKDFLFAVDTVLLAPARTPPDIVKWLEAETLKVLKSAEMKEKLFKAGFEVRPKGADAAFARVTKEVDKFRDIINQAGIKKI